MHRRRAQPSSTASGTTPADENDALESSGLPDFTNFLTRSRRQRDDFDAFRGPGRVAAELDCRKLLSEGTMSYCVCGHPEEAHLFGGRCRVPECTCDRFWPIPEVSAQMCSRLMRTQGDF